MKTKLYQGFISTGDYGETDDCLLLSTLDEPLADILQDDISEANVTVRYWILDKECSKNEAQERFIKTAMGAVDVEFSPRYSDLTGYLWTDESLEVGGHDLLQELKSAEGKYLILEIDVYNLCIYCNQEITNEFISVYGDRKAHSACYHKAHPFIDKECFKDVLTNNDDQVLVRELLMKLVDGKTKSTIVSEFNRIMMDRYNSKISR